MEFYPYPELETLDLEELIDRFYKPSPTEDDYLYHQEVATFIREKGREGSAFLIKALNDVKADDEKRILALLVGLSFPTGPNYRIEPLSPKDQVTWRRHALFYLHDDRPYLLKAAVQGLKFQGVKDAVDTILSLRFHPYKYLRESVLEYLAEVHPDRAFPILIEAFKDEENIVRATAATALGYGEIENVEAIPHLRLLLSDPDPSVREAAQESIERLENLPK